MPIHSAGPRAARRALCAAGLLCLVAAGSAGADDTGVLFLNLEKTEAGYLLRSASVHPGRLKTPRGEPREPALRVDLLDASGRRLTTTTVPDPWWLRRLGTEGPDPVTGTWEHPSSIPEPDHLVVRVPYRSETRFVRLARMDDGARTPGDAETRLGTFALPAGMEPPPASRRAASPLRPLAVTGAPRHRINVLFLAEGYTRYDMPLFRGYAKDAFQYLMSLAPFKSYASLFNAYYLEVVSRESGCDHPGTALDESGSLPIGFVDTYFDASFDVGGIHRCVYIGDVPLAFDTLADDFTSYDITVVVVNSSEYGGCAGEVAVGTSTGQSKFLLVHEIGHTFVHLGDEYEDGGFASPRPGPEPVSPAVAGGATPNISLTAVREEIPWSIWIEPSTPLPTPETADYAEVIGAFRGAQGSPSGGYRPRQNCLMRDLTQPFCEVCAEAAIRCIYNLLDPIQDWAPETETLALGPGESAVLSVVPLVPDDHALQVSWLVDGVIVPGADGDSLTVDADPLAAGLHTITATVVDPNPAVRNDPDGLLQSSRQWTVDRRVATAAAGPALRTRPNPFSSRTAVFYDLPAPASVRLEVFDLQGRQVALLEEREVPAGPHRAEWDGRLQGGGRAPAGIYFLRLRTEDRTTTTRVVLTPGG